MATQLEIVNEVLRRLREATVATVAANDYSRLIAAFVNQAKSEVEEAFTWPVLRETKTFTLAADTSSYLLTGVLPRAILLPHPSGGRYVFNQTAGYRLRPVPWTWIDEQLRWPQVPKGPPVYFAVSSVDATNNSLTVRVWPVPSTSGDVVALGLYNPQPDMGTDGTDDNTPIKVPGHLVSLGTYAIAVAERGETGGMSASEAYVQFREALSRAVAAASGDLAGEFTWRAV